MRWPVTCLLLFGLLGVACAAGNSTHAAAGEAEKFVVFPDLQQQESRRPSNITATYKGKWTSRRGFSTANGAPFNTTNATSLLPWLQQQSGTVIILLQTYATSTTAVQYVAGEVTLRDGEYVTDTDVRLPFEGVYVPQTGELRMLLESDAIINVSVAEKAELGETYRGALYDAVAELDELQKRALLRPDLAPKLAQLTDLEARQAGGGIAGLRKRCRFKLVTVVGPRVVSADGPLSIAVGGTLFSPNCGVELEMEAEEVHMDRYFAKAENYSLLSTAVTVALIVLVHQQMEHAGTQAGMNKISLLTVGQQAVMDSYLCLIHLTTGLVVEDLFSAFAGTAFLQFVLFSFFEMKFIVLIWKARRPEAFQGGWRREMGVLHSYFYGALLGGVVLMYQLQWLARYLLFGFLSFWVWQIAHNVHQDVVRPLMPRYILGTSAARLALPLYVYGCPRNFLRVKPAPGLCWGLLAWVGFQVAVLLSQHAFGSRWFVPRRWRPQKYEYHRPVPASVLEAAGLGYPEEGQAGGVDCVICMGTVEADRPAARMVTPCDHFFHTACLTRWMEIKMECPTCRRVLPQP